MEREDMDDRNGARQHRVTDERLVLTTTFCEAGGEATTTEQWS
jgi:hypothetical protein